MEDPLLSVRFEGAKPATCTFIELPFQPSPYESNRVNSYWHCPSMFMLQKKAVRRMLLLTVGKIALFIMFNKLGKRLNKINKKKRICD